ncbi:MAG: phage tail sheath C-terminal domain-containing protein [Armatimonadota bacterium]
MSTALSPGVYTRETDFSFYIKQISTSVCGMVGVAEKGPINQPTLVTSWEQFTRKFGSYITGGYLAYAARLFYDNGGSVLYVSRTAHMTDPTDKATLTATCAGVTVKNRKSGEAALDTLKFAALTEGKWGNGLSVEIADGRENAESEFDLLVSYKGELVEVFRNLTMSSADLNHIEMAVNGVSEYITAEDLSPTANTAQDRPLVGTFALATGEDGVTGMADSDYTGDPALRTGLYAFDEIDALSILLVPGVSSASVIQSGCSYAESRKDLLYITEAPLHLEPLEVIEFRKGQGVYTHSAFNSSYAAMYYPWLEIQDPLTGKGKFVPPSGAVAGCIARNDQKAEVWYAPAGIDRGRIFNALSLAYKTSRGERDALYSEGINAIASFVDSGINIWGQKTLQSQPSATDRINVRRLMMYVAEAISQSARYVLFEPNNAQTWRALVRIITPFLQGIKGKGGFYDFRVQCDDETNTPQVIDQNQMVARVFVKPIKTAEFVELSFILTATGANFREVL